MGQVFDEADYRRRLDALRTSDISVGEEVGLIWQGWVSGSGSGPLNARNAVLDAKRRALEQARDKMIDAIHETERERSINGFLPTEVEQIVTGQSDKLVKV
jgi:phage-related minor tail protein